VGTAHLPPFGGLIALEVTALKAGHLAVKVINHLYSSLYCSLRSQDAEHPVAQKLERGQRVVALLKFTAI
jgi:hypothetical protein